MKEQTVVIVALAVLIVVVSYFVLFMLRLAETALG